jgi:multicomponent K+:H+ antiporter subunit E
MSRLLPHPVLSALVAIVWVGLINDFSLGSLLFGLLLGVLIPLLTSPYWPETPVIRRPLKVVEYILVVFWDIAVSNVQVAYLILFRSSASLRSQFVTVPIELQSPEAITVLAGTITMTPGTVSSDIACDGCAILVHCLDTADPADVVATIKGRYERRLKEIFE